MFSRYSYQMEQVALLCDQTGRNRKWEIQDGGLQTSNTCNSACTIDSNEIPSAIPMFSGNSYPMTQVALLYDQTERNRKCKIQDGGRYTLTAYSSASRQDIDENPTVIPMFSESSSPFGTHEKTMRANRKWKNSI